MKAFNDIFNEREFDDVFLGSGCDDTPTVLLAQPNSRPSVLDEDLHGFALDRGSDNEANEIWLILKSSAVINEPGMLGPSTEDGGLLGGRFVGCVGVRGLNLGALERMD